MSVRTSDTNVPPNPPLSGSDIILPRWQPDSEVTKCPVCHTEFGLWFRKHHCRKCGRVICSSCSPHRITIPKQYIVQPPGIYGEEMVEQSALGGGEVVRVCKPCVPDPWTPNANSPVSPSLLPSHDGLTSLGQDADVARRVDRRFHRPIPPSPASRPEPRGDIRRGSRDASGGPGSPTNRQLPVQSRQPASRAERYAVEIHRLSADGQESRFPARPYRHSHGGGSSSLDIFNAPWLTTRSRANTSDATRNLPRPGQVPPQPSASTPPSAPPRRRRVAEEDECPVCGEEMAPGEAAREAHITECITSRFSSGSVPRAAPDLPPPLVAAATPPTGGSLPPTASPLGTSIPITTRPRATSYRPRGMAIYKATEKDCTTEDGEPQECVICFEEFQPGDELGRMECWCKFHRTCIRQWWETKGTGSCPTHQLHE